MRIVSRLLEGTMALVFVFGLLGSLLTGSKPGGRGLGRRPYSTRPPSTEAWIGGYAGAMGWDGQVLPSKSEAGSPPARGRRPARLTRARRQPIKAQRVLASAARRRAAR